MMKVNKKDNNSKNHKWITLVNLGSMVEAEVAASFLRSHGLTVQLRDVFIAGIQPLCTPVIGGIRLDVLSHEFEMACQLLEEVKRGDRSIR